MASGAEHRSTLFVYGTLKRGRSRHAAIARQHFVGVARTSPRYRIVNLGGFPALVDGGTSSIVGELWSIDAACLARLDRIERVADRMYRRSAVTLAPPHESIVAEAYFYVPDVSTLPDHGEEW